MYVTFIPFFLKAILSIDNVEKWTLGPEYLFKLNKVVVIYTATPITEVLTATVKCQPKVGSSNMICCIQNVTFLTTLNHKNNTQRILEHINTEQVFEINFNERGVQSLAMELNSHIGLNIVKWIVQQFNVGINLKIESERNVTNFKNVKTGLDIIDSFTNIENIWKNSKCNTSYLITYRSYNKCYYNFNTNDLALNKISHPKVQENDFQLVVLPIFYMNSISQFFSIERHRETCIIQPRYLKLHKEVWNIHKLTRYFNKIEIKDKRYKFLSYTHLEGRLSQEYLTKKPMFKERVHLNLIEIKPALKTLFMKNEFIFQSIDT